MSEPTQSPLPRTSPVPADLGWTRRRIIFVSLAVVLALVLIWLAGSVLIPFIIAALLAYVLVPLVAVFENHARMPRSAAIIVVYLLVFGLGYLFFAAVAPRIYDETARLAREAPQSLREGAQRYGPRVESWARAYLGRAAEPVPPEEPEPTLRAQREADGSLSIELRGGVEVTQDSPGRWRVVPEEDVGAGGFGISEMIEQGVERFFKYLQRNIIEFVKVGQRVLASTARAVFLFFMTLMVAGYLIHTREQVVGFFRSLAPPFHRPGFDLLLIRLDRGLSGVIRGQLLICLVNGVLSAVGFWFLELKYWPLLALIAGVMSIVPIFGSILSTIPAVLVGLTQDLWTALWVLLWIVFIHQLEANLLNPKIIGVSAKIHPVLVVFALLVGEHVYGLWGAVLAVPALSVTQSIFNHFRFTLPDAGPDTLSAQEVAKAQRKPRKPSKRREEPPADGASDSGGPPSSRGGA